MDAPRTPALVGPERAAAYRLIAELLLYPEDRRAASLQAWRAALQHAPHEVRAGIDRFQSHARADDPEEYLAVLELAPPCPLYVGAYLFDEPTTCRGAGLSPRNAYMVEVAAAYRHFGYELDANELSDFLPVMLEFLALTVEHEQPDDIGLRRRFLERYLAPGLPAMKEALIKHESPYRHLVDALEALIHDDLAASEGVPAWTPERLAERAQVASPNP